MDVVIIGNGIAGTSAASTLRALSDDAEITLISDEPCEAYSACVLPRYIAGVIERQRVFLPNDEHDGSDIRRILGQAVTAVDTSSKSISMGRETLHYDRLILATGSRPLVPRIPGVDKKGVFVLKRLADGDGLKSHGGTSCVVIGSGLVGVEAAEALAKAGYKVYLVEMLEWILPRALDREPAEMMANVMREHGVDVLTSEKVVSISGRDRVESVVTSAREIPCDTVVLALGMRPEVELAKATGVELGAVGGIRVDDFMMTNIEDVYACGDCIESTDLVSGQQTLSLLWGSARQQGETAALSIAGRPKAYGGSMNIMAADIFDTPIASIGANSFTAGPDARVTERVSRKCYSRTVTVDGIPVGAQFVGEAPGIGVLLTGVRRKASGEALLNRATNAESLRAAPWYGIIKKYI